MPHYTLTAFDQGWVAWTDGATLKENPYSPDSKEHIAWVSGWKEAYEDYFDPTGEIIKAIISARKMKGE